MGSHDDLLAAIRHDLDDDGPRLVYADALQAAGDPRGELIAVQCEIARLGLSRLRKFDWVGAMAADLAAIDSGRLKKLRAREDKLLATHRATWSAGLAGLSWSDAHRFARGFVEHLAWWPMLDQVEPLFAAAPALRSIEILPAADRSADPVLAQSTELRQIRRIVIGVGEEARVLPIFESPHLSGVRELAILSAVRITPAIVDALVRAPWFGRLETLDLYQMPHERIAELAQTAGPLVELRLGTNIGSDFTLAARLAGCSGLAALEVLDLKRSYVGRQGAEAIAASPHLQKLRALRLSDNDLDVDGAAAIGNAFPALRVLDLTRTRLFGAGWKALLAGRGLGQLTDLRLEETTTGGDDAVRALAASPMLARLRALNLRNNHITDAGAELLAASEHCRNLLTLDVIGNKGITKRGLTALAKSPHLAKCRITKSRSRERRE